MVVGVSLDPAAALRLLDGISSAGVLHALRDPGAALARELSPRVGGGALRALLPQQLHAGDDGAGGAARALHARRLRLRALRFPRQGSRVPARAGAAHDHARRAHRGELPHHGAPRHPRHDPGHRASLHGLGVRDIPVEADLQDRAARAGRGGASGGRERATGAVEGLRPARAPGLPRLRPGLGELPLEQLPLAAHRHQLGHLASRDRGPAGVLRRRPGHRLVGDHGGHGHDIRSAAHRVPVVPAPVRAVVHARRDPLGKTTEEVPMLRIARIPLAVAALSLALAATAQYSPPNPPPSPAPPTVAAPAAPAAPAQPQFDTTRVEGTDNVYIFRLRGAQAMFVVTSEGVIATDPIGYGYPNSGQVYLDEIRKVTDKPVKY